MNIRKGKESVLFATKIFQMKGRIRLLNNDDKINILIEAIIQYYNDELKNMSREKLDVVAAKKTYDDYSEILNWLEDLKEFLNLRSERVELK